MHGEKAILFATDPPYLVDYDGTNHPSKQGGAGQEQDPMGGWTAAGSLTEWGCSSDQPLWRRPWKRSPTALQN